MTPATSDRSCLGGCLAVLLTAATAAMFGLLWLHLYAGPRAEDCDAVFETAPPAGARDVRCVETSSPFGLRGELWMQFTLPADRVQTWWTGLVGQAAAYPAREHYVLEPGLGWLADERGPYGDWALDEINSPLTADVPEEESAQVVIDPGAPGGTATVYIHGTWD